MQKFSVKMTDIWIMSRILIIDESNILKDTLVTFLKDFYDVKLTEISNSLHVAQTFQPSVAILNLDKIHSATQWIHQMRSFAELSNVGVLLITPNNSQQTQELAYNAQADGFLSLPLDFTKMLWKIKSLERRVLGSFNTIPEYTLNELRLVPSERYLDTPQGRIKLLPIHASLLHAFFKNPGKPLSRTWLKLHVWSSQNISSRSIDAQISKLKKLNPLIADHIESLYGNGYLWVTEPENIKKVSGD